MTTNKFYNQTASSTDYAVSPDNTNLDISHELRTPLTVIQGALELLDSGHLGPLSAQGRRMVKIAANNVERLMRLTTAIEEETETAIDLLSGEQLARLRLERELKLALPQQQMRLQYQPIVSLATGRITGFEVLARWHHPTLGLISPTQFIPIAEETGSIIDIGTWVIRESCLQLQAWQQDFPTYFEPLTISVNLSCKQIACPDLPQQIEQILQETGLPPRSLKLEITESSIMDNKARAKLKLKKLN